MATTNIDAVAEFKVLTNAYQAEYGRAVGGQMQVVTKSGAQHFHGSGYWYGRRSGLEREHLDEQARGTPEIEPPSRRATTTATPSAGRSSFPASTTDKKKLFFFWSQEFQRRTDPAAERPGPRADRARAARGFLAERRQPAATRSPTSATTRPACPAAPPTRAAASRTAACSARFPRAGSTRPASRSSTSIPHANFSGGSGINYRARSPTARRGAKTCSASTSRPPTTGASPAAT